MSDEIEKKEAQPLQILPPGQVAVTVSVTSHGKLEDAEELARAVVKAMRVIVPGAPVGG